MFNTRRIVESIFYNKKDNKENLEKRKQTEKWRKKSSEIYGLLVLKADKRDLDERFTIAYYIIIKHKHE
jgi:hypothetical protein